MYGPPGATPARGYGIYAPRTRYTRSAIARRPRRRTYVPRPIRSRQVVSRLTGLGVGTTTTMNVHKDRIGYFQKSFVANTSAGAGVGVSSLSSFDPSGTLATSAGTALNFGGGAIVYPDWAALTALYDQYKITRIRVTMTGIPNGAVAGATLDTDPADVLMRYCYDPTVALSTAACYQMPSIKRHLFTTANPTVSFDVIPYMQRVTYDPGAALAASGFEIVPFDWIDVDNPALCWGALYLATVLQSGISIRIDVTMDISFRYNR